MNQTADRVLSGWGWMTVTQPARTIFALLEKISGGLLEVRLPDGDTVLLGHGGRCLTLQIHDEAVFGRVLARGDIGLAEAYCDGQWSTSDLPGLLTLLACNRDVLARAIQGSWRLQFMAHLRHWRKHHDKVAGRRNTMTFNEPDNDFYCLWLDPGMSYSAALFRPIDDGSLAVAQTAKYQRILGRLGARPGLHILDIGCGWGAFAEAAVRQGLSVTGLTPSPAQWAWARQRVPEADVRCQDDCEIEGCFDHVVSIEQVETVGEAGWPGYFASVARALKPGGKALIQSITLDEKLFARYRRGTDFIRQYIFPGSLLPSAAALRQAAADQGLKLTEEFSFGPHYARTLAFWRRAFEAHWPQIAALGFDEPFHRLWHFYLAYCEAGFLAGNLDVTQFEFMHADAGPGDSRP